MPTLQKMKTLSILVLTLGIVGVIANPVSKQTIKSENNNSPRAESSESQTKHGDVINTSNKGDQEQKKDTLIENPESPNIIDTSKDVDADGKVEIIIEENLVSPDDDSHILPVDKCEHDQDKYIPENLGAPNINTDKDIEIIIEENLVSPIDENPERQDSADNSPLSGDFSGEPLPHMPGAIEDAPPGIIGEGPQMPNFIDDHQVSGEFGGPQFPGFINERPQLPGFIGGIPQFAGFIEGGQHMPGFNDHGPQHPDNEDDLPIDKDYFREDMQKIEHEIMETAAGFIPTPLVFRRKQKPRRRFATRRHFRRNPYRRHQFFYPYSYYAYYRPSSLRFY